MSEPFDWKKLLVSPMTGLFWVKCTMFGMGFLGIVLVGYAVFKAYIKKPEPTTTQKADTIQNYTYSPRVTFGCATLRDGRFFNSTRTSP